MIEIALPYPLSVNRIYKPGKHGGIYKVDEAKDYQEEVGWCCRIAGLEPIQSPATVRVELTLYRPRQSGDVDNPDKLLLDALQGHAYTNDNQIIHLTVIRQDDPANPRVEVRVYPYEHPVT